ncbi:MAG: hypothetical protein PHE09_02015 [Oscillospiraceae bacterium]|nr:hypothetical protein [Oscillospiraceae bacterium]
MNQLENIDLREALGDIARNNTAWHLENDFAVSIGQMERAVKMDDSTEKTLIWISYPAGIDCYSERDVFQKDTRGFNGVQYHANGTQHERKLAYAVEVTGDHEGKLMGNLFEIDLQAYGAFAQEKATPSHTMRLFLTDAYDRGAQTVMSKQEFDSAYPQQLPEMKYWRHEPSDPGALEELLNRQYVTRSLEAEPCDLWLHTSNLYDERLIYYSEKILETFGKLSEANSPDQRYFSVALPSFVAAAFHAEQLSRLLDTLPFDSTAFSIHKGQRELHVEVPRDEMIRLREAETLARDYHALMEDFDPYGYRDLYDFGHLNVHEVSMFEVDNVKKAIRQDAKAITKGGSGFESIKESIEQLTLDNSGDKDLLELAKKAWALISRLNSYAQKHHGQRKKSVLDFAQKPSLISQLKEGKKTVVQSANPSVTIPKRSSGREV